MRSRGFAIIFVLVAGLLAPQHRDFAHVEKAVAAQIAKSDRALDRAVQQLPAMSELHRRALLACIDHHLVCNRRDLVAAVEANQGLDPNLAALGAQEVAEYRATERKLRELRNLIEQA